MSKFPNRRWLVVPATEVPNINLSQILQFSLDSLRYSVDGTKAIIKYEVRVVEETYTETHLDPETQEESTITIEAGIYGRPDIYSQEYMEYDHAGILQLLSTEEWTDPT